MPSKKRKMGDLGEYYAGMFLVKHGFNIIKRNYLKKWGEIDIIAEKGGVIHFVEVKSVARETLQYQQFRHRPEENVDRRKIGKIERTAEIFINEYCLENKQTQIDVITIDFLMGETLPQINYIPNANL